MAPRVETSAVVAAVAASNRLTFRKLSGASESWRRFFFALRARISRARSGPVRESSDHFPWGAGGAFALKSPAFTIENFAGTR